jgi:hypothetical protein
MENASSDVTASAVPSAGTTRVLARPHPKPKNVGEMVWNIEKEMWWNTRRGKKEELVMNKMGR